MSDPSEEQLLAGIGSNFYIVLLINDYYFIAVKDSLEKDGRLGRFKAELRAAVISLLSRRTVEGTPPDVPPETKLVNELFREYLIWNGYTYTEQLLVAGTFKKKAVDS